MTKSDLIMVGLNLIVCLVGIAVCLNRMGHMSRSTTKLSIRVQYASWVALFVASMISWTYDEPASLTQLVMTMAILGQLLLGTDAWKYGPPDYTMRHAGAD